MIKDKIATRLKDLRIKSNLSQEELACLAKLDRTYITYLETGKKNVTVNTLYKITNALNISLKDFFDFDNFDIKLNDNINNQNDNLELVKDMIYTNQQINKIFLCSIQGGIRVSRRKKTITLITNHGAWHNPYNDSHINEDGSFIYTGMGLRGDQEIKETNQNGKVANSDKNGYRLFYFVMIGRNKYLYKGECVKNGSFYYADEIDNNGNKRKVVKFRLKIIK